MPLKITYFFKKNTSTMSVSAAISSANFEALEQAVTGKDNEVFSTILFDSYDDKRIEELLLLEAIEFMKENPPQKQETKVIDRIDLSKGTRHSICNPINLSEWGLENELEFTSGYSNTISAGISSDFNSGTYISSHVSAALILKNKVPLRTPRMLATKYILRHRHGDIAQNVSIDFHKPYNEPIQFEVLNSPYNYVNYPEFVVEFFDDTYNTNEHITGSIRLPIYIKRSDVDGITDEECKEFLLKRICERHAMNETLVQSMKKKLEIERLYYKMKDLYDEDVKLTRTINSKHEQLNSLQEDICAKKVELNQLDMRILQAQNDLEALAYHRKQMELATEINNEVTLLEDDKEALDAKRMHDYYVNFANDLKVYKFAFEHMREISMKLEQERKDFEEYKAKETKELEDKISRQYDALRDEKLKFDEDCEAYEEESTKWKSMQESKFAKYQRQIDNYDYVVDERDRLEREVEKLNKELKSVTSERDRYRTTIETLSSFRK